VKTPVADCRRVAIISRKGGIGKTTTTLMLGHTFATHRGDRVIALDTNPDAGSLGYRVKRQTTATVADLLEKATEIARHADIKVTPDFSGLPGSGALEKMVNGLAAFGLLACVAAVIIGGAAWGLGHQSSNYQYSSGGKRGVLGGLTGAFVIGGVSHDHQLLLQRRARNLAEAPRGSAWLTVTSTTRASARASRRQHNGVGWPGSSPRW